MNSSRCRISAPVLLAGLLALSLGGCVAAPLVGMMAAQPATASAAACQASTPGGTPPCPDNPLTAMFRGLGPAQPGPQPVSTGTTALR
ncbi:MAG: hypothetical protein AB7O80_07405 [Acetobacteraceae bacterium]